MNASVARGCWLVLEPCHATVYFAPEVTAYTEAGLKGYWMGYFASRSAAMGPVPAEVVIATFYNFHPALVGRAIPDAWRFSTPDRVLAARYRVADAATRRYLGVAFRGGAVMDAAEIAERAARTADPVGRPLFAAHASLPWPDEPHLRLWHAATLLREHRGDGHVATLVTEGIDGFEAHVLAAAAGRIDPVWQRQARGISVQEWDATVERLRARRLVQADGSFTDAGRALSQQIEDRTDALALGPYVAIGDEACARPLSLMAELRPDGSVIPANNPIGLPATGSR